jgi:uncharacterized protein YutE (UPF0331/DUF86 family)
MSPDTLRRQLGQLRRYLDDLRPYAAMNDKERKANRYAIERLLELVVSGMIDVAFHVVRMRGLTPPGSYREGFELLAANALLPEELAKRLEKAAGFRNLLVHEYGDLDEQKVFAAISPALKDGEAFFHLMTTYVDGSG